MSFPAERQAKLNPLVESLEQVPGVFEVQQDDFDSMSINIFLFLDVQSRNCGRPFIGERPGRTTGGRRPHRFVETMRSMKAGIKRACKKHGVNFSFLSW